MRKQVVLGFVLALAACGGQDATSAPPQPPVPPPAPVATAEATPPAASATAATPPPPPAPSLSEKILTTVAASFDTQNAHDAAKYAALFTEDATYTTAGAPPWNGRAAIAKEQQSIFDDMPTGKWAATRVYVKDDVAIVEWVAAGTDKKSSKPYGVNGASVMRFTPDGMIKEEHDYIDFPTFLAQVGQSKEKGRAVVTLPSGPPEMHVAKGTPEEAANADRVKQVQAAFVKNDRKVVADAYTDDVSWDDFTAPSPMNGKETILKMFDANAKAWTDPKLDCQTWAIESVVASECAFQAKNTGPLAMSPTQKIPATKKSVDVHGLDIIQLKDGKATKGRSYGNGMEFAVQMGLMKPPAPPKADKKADTAKAPKKQ